MRPISPLRSAHGSFTSNPGILQSMLLRQVLRIRVRFDEVDRSVPEEQLRERRQAALPIPRPRCSVRSQIPIIGHRDAAFGPHCTQCQLTDPVSDPSSITTDRPPSVSSDAARGSQGAARGPKSSKALSHRPSGRAGHSPAAGEVLSPWHECHKDSVPAVDAPLRTGRGGPLSPRPETRGEQGQQ